MAQIFKTKWRSTISLQHFFCEYFKEKFNAIKNFLYDTCHK